MEGVNELALFAGAGGGILAGHLLGWRTVCAVEWEPYAACVLAARQNDGILPPFPIWDDIQTFDGRPWRGIVDVVSGGFPCQDISAAGKGAGIEGERSGLWREMARVVGEVRPRYVFVENSPMLTARGGARVIADLTEIGYDAQWDVMGAADVGAPHQRDRIWIVAHTRYWGRGDFRDFEGWENPSLQWATNTDSLGRSSVEPKALADPYGSHLEGGGRKMIRDDGKSREDMLDWLVEQNGGRLNPTWVEWLMGWPLEWTDLKPLEMDKFQQWQQQHSICSQPPFVGQTNGSTQVD